MPKEVDKSSLKTSFIKWTKRHWKKIYAIALPSIIGGVFGVYKHNADIKDNQFQYSLHIQMEKEKHNIDIIAQQRDDIAELSFRVKQLLSTAEKDRDLVGSMKSDLTTLEQVNSQSAILRKRIDDALKRAHQMDISILVKQNGYDHSIGELQELYNGLNAKYETLRQQLQELA